MAARKPVSPETYDQTYFESGLVAGVSGYMNYTWLAEQTLRMAHRFILDLPIRRGDKVLDFGCAKGFLVKAFRILDVEAYGADVSKYALDHAPVEVADYCSLISGCDDSRLFPRSYDWLIGKDVFEHLVEKELRTLLRHATGKVKKMFAAIPLAANDECGKYIIPAYDQDITHVTAKTLGWWKDLFVSEGWRVETAAHTFEGCKENWTKVWNEGNAFFIISSGRDE